MVIETLSVGSSDAPLPSRLLTRSTEVAASPEQTALIRDIAEQIKRRGDDAVVELTRKHDAPSFCSPYLTEQAKADAIGRLSPGVRRAIQHNIANARAFNASIMEQQRFAPIAVEEGVSARLVARPIRSAALYVPCGRAAYPSSLINVATPAVVAGVPRVEVLVPPRPDGSVDGAVLFAAQQLGLPRAYCGNGLAITLAAAIGTETLVAVDKIVGPGGAGIVAAQTYAGTLGVDVARNFGPSECMIVADDVADPELVAADMLNEAEHGPHSSAILITDSPRLARDVAHLLGIRLQQVPEARRSYARDALRNGAILVVSGLEVAIALANRIGNEHIQVVCRDAERVAERLVAGAEILVGQYTPFSAISYAVGVPTCLPTGPFVHRFSGVTALTFLRYSAVASVTRVGLSKLAETISELATYEDFPSHVESIALRRRRGLLS